MIAKRTFARSFISIQKLFPIWKGIIWSSKVAQNNEVYWVGVYSLKEGNWLTQAHIEMFAIQT